MQARGHRFAEPKREKPAPAEAEAGCEDRYHGGTPREMAGGLLLHCYIDPPDASSTVAGRWT